MIEITREEDQQSRRIAQSEFSRHVIVEAGAGTGKTATLIARIVCWSLTNGWDKHKTNANSPEDIALSVARAVASITFTDNACREMADRLGLAYQELVSKSELDNDTVVGLDLETILHHISEKEIRSRSLALLGVCDQFRIQTIHSFCRRILSRFPRQAGLHLYYTLDADQIVTDRLLNTVLLADLQDAYSGSKRHQKHYRFLLSQGQSIESIASVVRSLLQQGIPVQDVMQPSVEPHNIVERYQELLGVIDRILLQYDQLSKPFRSNSIHHKIKAFLEELQSFLETYSSTKPLEEHEQELVLLWETLQKKYPTVEANIKKRRQPPTSKKPQYPDNVLDLTREFQELLPLLAAFKLFRPYSLSIVQELTGNLLPQLRQGLSSKGILGFNDLLREAKELLERRGDIAVELASELDLLMVDEFQDTSLVQCAFLEALVLAVEDQEKPAPKLFIVGDPKQSIYGWRQANIASYFSFVEKLCSRGGLRLDLVVNYRSTPRILNEVRHIFQPIMHRELDAQPPFVPLLPARADERYQVEKDAIAPVEYWISWSPPEVEKANAEECRRNQARMIVQDIIRQRSKKEQVPEFSDFAILFRSSSNIDILLSILQEHNIPYVVSGDENFYRRKEIIDAVSLLLALFDPSDQVSLIALLRSKIVGLPDCALYPLWREGFPQFFLEAAHRSDRQEQIAFFCSVLQDTVRTQKELLETVALGDWIGRFQLVMTALFALQLDMQRLPTDVFLYKLRRCSLLEVVEASATQSQYRLENLDLFFLELFQHLERASGNWAEVLLMLRRSVQQEESKTEASSKDSSSNAVQILSIHRAKGLDFKQVYLVDIDRRPPMSQVIPTIAEKDARGKWIHSLAGYCSFGVQERLLQERQRECYERVRVFYVALTRAKDRLVLIGNWVGKPSSSSLGRSVTSATSFLELLFANEKEMDGRLQAISDVVWEHLSDRMDVAYPYLFTANNILFRVGYAVVPPLSITEEDGSAATLEDASLVLHHQGEQIPTVENRIALEATSSILDVLVQRAGARREERRGDISIERSYRNLLEIQNRLLLQEGISQEGWFDWREKVEQALFSIGSDASVLTETVTLLGTLELATPLQIPRLEYQGERILLSPKTCSAERQEYWIQGIIEREEEYLLVELIWDWTKTKADLSLHEEHDFLIRSAARTLRQEFQTTKPFRPAFFDLAKNSFVLL